MNALKIKGLKLLFCFLLLGLLSCISATHMNAQKRKPFDRVKIDWLLDSTFMEKQYGYSALVTKDFKEIYSKVGGYANLELYKEHPRPPHPHRHPPNLHEKELSTPIVKESKFRIGSITKQFTAVAILKLHEHGRLNISDTIQKFFPDFPKYQDTITNEKHSITIEHLLTHTSGLTDNYYLLGLLSPRVIYPKDARQFLFLDSFKDYPIQFKPGIDHEYSNFGYVLLGLIIEMASGKSYEDYLKENIFYLAGMENTTIDHPSKIIDNRAQGYMMGDSGLINAGDEDLPKAFSAGNIISTVGDLNKWYQALFNYQIISRDLLQKAHKPYTLETGEKINYGYGWGIFLGGRIIMHNGIIDGFRSNAIFHPSSKILAVLLSNFRYPLKNTIIEDLSTDMLVEGVSYSLAKKTITTNLKKGIKKMKPLNTIPIRFKR